MKYPYIGESTVTERKVLFTLPGVGFDFYRMKMKGGFDESVFKNITAEYLANTYGEVKSKEHAEFIVRLAEVNGFTIEFISNFEEKSFIIKNECLSIFNIHINGLDKENLNKITIPLPPECEKPPIGGGQSMDYNNCRCSTAPALNDEWPKVGDEVVTNSGKGVVKLPPDNSGFYVVSVAGEYLTLKITAIQKPKTPEQELRDDIIKTIHDDVYNGTYGKESFDIFADALMAKYNITKKGEGDE